MDSEAPDERGRFRAHVEELNLLLWAVWNPIGVDVPLDEYESYVPIVWKLLSEHADVGEIAAELDRIAHQRMGVSSVRGRETAERLSQWWYWRFDFPVEFDARS